MSKPWFDYGDCFYIDNNGKGRTAQCLKERKSEKPNTLYANPCVSKQGRHEWKLELKKLQYKSYIIIGITTNFALKNKDAFHKRESLAFGYCYDGTKRNGKFKEDYPTENSNKKNKYSSLLYDFKVEYDEQSSIGVILDLDYGVLSFTNNDNDLGISIYYINILYYIIECNISRETRNIYNMCLCNDIFNIGVAFKIDSNLEWRMAVSVGTASGNRIKLSNYKMIKQNVTTEMKENYLSTLNINENDSNGDTKKKKKKSKRDKFEDKKKKNRHRSSSLTGKPNQIYKRDSVVNKKIKINKNGRNDIKSDTDSEDEFDKYQRNKFNNQSTKKKKRKYKTRSKSVMINQTELNGERSDESLSEESNNPEGNDDAKNGDTNSTQIKCVSFLYYINTKYIEKPHIYIHILLLFI